MQPVFFCKEFFDGFPIHLVGDTAVDRANRSALGLFMKTLTFGAFIGNDIIGIDTDRGIALVGVDDGTIEQGKGSFYAAAIGYGPLHTTFIDGIVRALGLAGSAVDAFFGNLNSHFFENYGMIKV
jgi:hypothetical protein